MNSTAWTINFKRGGRPTQAAVPLARWHAREKAGHLTTHAQGRSKFSGGCSLEQPRRVHPAVKAARDHSSYA